MKKSLLFLISICIIGSVFSQKKKLYTAPCTTTRDASKSMTMGIDTTAGRGVANNYAMWDNGTEITVKFLNAGSKVLRDKVIQYSKEWEQFANVRFRFVPDNTPVTNLRVLLGEGHGHNSFVGTDANQIPQSDQTINLDTLDFVNQLYYVQEMKKKGMDITWANLRTMLANGPVVWNSAGMRGTVLHEFGHSLGLMHEQSFPRAIKWNKDTVYKYYRKTQGWDEDKVNSQVFEVADQFYTNGTRYDAKSIMHYPIEAWQTTDGSVISRNEELSAGDRELIAALYPKDKRVSVLEVPRVKVGNFQKMDVVNNTTKKGLSIYPSFDMQTNSKLGEVYVFARPVDENDNFIKSTGDSYNVNGYVGAYTKLMALPNSKVSYNSAGKKDLELFIPYTAIPVQSGTQVRFYTTVVVHDVVNNKFLNVGAQLTKNSVSITK